MTGVTAELKHTNSNSVTDRKEGAEPTAVGVADRCVLPVVSEQDVQSSQRAELQGSLVLAEEGGEDRNGVGENWPQIDFQRRAGDQRQSCRRHKHNQDLSGKY